MAKTLVTYGLTRGLIGADVTRLQQFLVAELGEALVLDGVYGVRTFEAVNKFQARHGLAQDGQCKAETLRKARDRGYPAVEYLVGDGNDDMNWPKKPPPSLIKQPTAEITMGLFGQFSFQHTPTPGNPQKIHILGNWVSNNIRTVTIPQLVGVPIPVGAAHAVPSDGKIQCHKDASETLLKLFQAWEDAGLKPKILTWYGAFNARLKRGTINPIPENLSNHSWGSAFDINAKQNWIGDLPAIMGQRGCVREFVEIANALGVYWGGHFGSSTTIGKRDGMHFEIARL